MKFTAILDGIETILKADNDTKDVIKEYRRFIVEHGIRATPFCLIRKVHTVYRERNSKGTIWDGEIFVDFLGQAYEIQSRYLEMIETLDKLQDNAYDAFMANPLLADSVRTSKVSMSENINIDEYFGFEIKIAFTVMTT